MEDNSKVFKSNITLVNLQEKDIEGISLNFNSNIIRVESNEKYELTEDNPKVFKSNITRVESQETIEDNPKVFKSNITRVESQEKNNLYDLIHVVPAKPISVHHEENNFISFIPKTDKYYIPKKRSRLKVNTVRDIRRVFEEDTYSYLNDEIEKQQSFLLRKIRCGTSNNESTREYAKKMLGAEYPLSRSSWQMLSNINPNNSLNPQQYVVWQGKLIQICGSKGGESKIVFNYDKSRKSSKKLNVVKTEQTKRRGLLRNSLAVKFKPGPLRRKMYLDDSHQKYHLGEIKLIDIPQPMLEVKPSYGVVLDNYVSNLLNTFREENGLITEKWAEFSVSVLGKVDNKKIVQTNEECSTIFHLKYSLDKKRILMRQDIENIMCDINKTSGDSNLVNNVTTDLEVKSIMNDILNSVEISLTQHTMYCTEEESLPICNETPLNTNATMKEKSKKKYSSELDRLDVTVIKLPETIPSNALPCKRSFCRLGCICESLNQPFRLKQHCGNPDCMFGCKCEQSQYRGIELFDSDSSDLIPGLINLDKAINSGLAKEEQKFHQTVILSGEKSILLKKQKRNRKFTKRYADFCGSATSNTKRKTILKIVENKLNCGNIEPWCMVHNLYRCFCKGKFTESSFLPKPDSNKDLSTNIEMKETTTLENKILDDRRNSLDMNKIRDRPCLRTRVERKVSDKYDLDIPKFDVDIISTCARTSTYIGRKHNEEYYRKTNNKILEMEKNDLSMQKKILKLAKINERIEENTENSNEKETLLEDSNSTDNTNSNSSEFASQSSDSAIKTLPNAVDKNKKLVSWLEHNYKIYKERLERGILKSSLDVPKKGKLALHTWEFILSRYRERKNHFMVLKEKPHRVFLAVKENKSLFGGCINIDDIRFADLNNYPIIVRNLLTNVTDLHNIFCILRGWDFCWELTGLVTKKSEPDKPNEKQIFDTKGLDPNKEISEESNKIDEKTEKVSEISDCTQENDSDVKTIPLTDQSERSKWFLMTIENDFTEIRFYNRGFYVKHESIQQAIELARVSKKTVRLSSQVRGEKSDPQFGIYATPFTNRLCVFVGPYELQEQLGLETIKNPVTRKEKKTRGVWVVTNKVDNMQVINDPLSFMPSKIEHNEIIVTHGSSTDPAYESSTDPADESSTSLNSPNINENNDQIKSNKKRIVKPIKISRTNGFYHLSSQSLLRHLPQYQSSTFQGSMMRRVLISPEQTLLKRDDGHNAEVSEALSSIKITSVYSEKDLDTKDIKKSDKNVGMFILKPEEINKKVLESQSQQDFQAEQAGTSGISNSEDAITHCEASSSSNKPKNEVLFISDDDDDDDNETDMSCKDIWIQTTNTQDLGWIVGMQNNKDKISFLLPGSKQFSDFYPQQEAFMKINCFLLNKNYITNQKNVKWEVVDTLDKVKGSPLSSLRKNYSPNAIEALEETSKLLEDESMLLWIEAKSKQAEIKTCLKTPENIPSEITDELQNMMEDLKSCLDDDEASTH